MRPGRLPGPPLKRAVLGQIKEGRSHKEKNIGVGCDAGFGIYGKEEGNSGQKEFSICVSDSVLRGAAPVDLFFSFHRGANSVIAAGGIPRWVTLTLLLPENWQEPEIRDFMAMADSLCAARKIDLIGGQTETMPGLTDLAASFHFTGTKYREDFPMQAETGKVHPGDGIVMSGFPAADLAGKWLVEEREKLEQRFCPEFLAQAEEKIFGPARLNFEFITAGPAWKKGSDSQSGEFPSVRKAACLAMDFGVKSMHDIGEGGIFGALRELGEREGCGLAVDLKKIPIQQEVIELCEFFDRNPYLTKSCGALLLVTPDPEGLVRILRAAGVPAAEIGQITDDRKMTIYHKEEIRYLDHPQMDEYWR